MSGCVDLLPRLADQKNVIARMTSDMRRSEAPIADFVEEHVVLTGDIHRSEAPIADFVEGKIVTSEMRRSEAPIADFVEGYVDGSFWTDERTRAPMIGAGVYFGDGDPENRCVPVPVPGIFPADSLRAELYAALLFVYLARNYKYKHRVRIFQDSVVAVHLLNSCKYGSCLELSKLCPSQWANEGRGETVGADGRKYRFAIDYVWGESVDTKTVKRYGDVLDMWWLFTRNAKIDVRWVQAHRTEPADRNSDDWRHWKGNQRADTFAKLGARTNRSDRDSVGEFAPYPLFRTDPSLNVPPKPDPKLDYLPLRHTIPPVPIHNDKSIKTNQPLEAAFGRSDDRFGPSLFHNNPIKPIMSNKASSTPMATQRLAGCR